MDRLRLLRVLAFALAVLGRGVPAAAHPVPFSYLDTHLTSERVRISLVVHIIDVAHDLKVDPPERLLEPAVLDARAQDIVQLVRERLRLSADGRRLADGTWSNPVPLAERQSLQLEAEYPTGGAAGVIGIETKMFPYDPAHQTFVNFYEGDDLASQAILDQSRTGTEYFAGTRQGVAAVIRKFLPSGVHHILIGPDHLLFLVGLLLLGGSLRQLLVVVTAFTVAHSVTLSLAALNIFTPPARVIEPAIALSIVYVGADNLMVRGGRDMRAWIAFSFGFIHGFGFANVLREMDLPSRALGWSLFSFNVGVEVGQMLVVIAVASVLGALRARNETAGRRLAFAGSIVVMAAGAFWFVQRVFFPGGMA
jgi:hydrogenase/urease accessory protein HupE